MVLKSGYMTHSGRLHEWFGTPVKKKTFNGVQNVQKQRPHRIYALFSVVEPDLGI
jgi:hypothetical protein